MIKVVNELETDFRFDKSCPLNEYPRPQLRRDSFLNLNGIWQYKIFSDTNIFINYNKNIVVPYPIESALSEVECRLEVGQKIGYKKEFTLPDGFVKDKTILHFGAVDQICDVYFNRNFVIHHEDGYTPFSVDVTRLLKETNEIVVIVSDNLDSDYPYGKQKNKNGGMWYTPVSGIWQTVWLESVNYEYIKNLNFISNIDSNEVTIEIEKDAIIEDIEKEITIYFNDSIVHYVKTSLDTITVKIDDVKLWTPENPNLYQVMVKMSEDIVYSYFGMRKLGVNTKDNHKFLALNNKRYYFHGLLDQGYYPDGLYTPKSYDVYRYELGKIKELGFNTLRKHIKVEPAIWYYLCDTMGIIVWQDFVNNGEYSFFKDTALPTFGKRKRRFGGYKRTKKSKVVFEKHMEEVVKKLKFFPSICLWTIFNEGWGQHDTIKMTNKLLSLDNTRFIDSASGWFYRPKENGIDSIHWYFKKLDFSKKQLRKYVGAYAKPLVISEFGGYSYQVPDHIYNDNHEYGYRKFTSIEEFTTAFKELYQNEIIDNLKCYISGSIYTQVSDVEDETNGILTYDRKVCKLNKEVAINISDKIKSFIDKEEK